MKKRNIFTVVFCAIALFVFLWLTRKDFKFGDGKLNRKEAAGSIHAELSPGNAVSANQDQDTLIENQRPDKATLLKLFGESANVPINFWGRVVDENGIGLGTVRIKYRIQRFKVLPSERSTGELVTNDDGSFGILNEKGATLSLEAFDKDGYQLMQNQKKVFGYSRTPEIFTPQANSPQMFIMRSRSARLDVSSISQKLRLPWDGKPIRIDLDSGNPSPSGELVLTASRTASTGRFGWSLSLAIDGGELTEAEPGTALVAPENGYLPVWQCGYEPDSNPWRFSRDANVYYRLNGNFGRLKLQIYAHAGSSDVSIHLERFINNSGGRNTEGHQ